MKPVESVAVDPVANVQLPPHHLVAAVPPTFRNFPAVESNELLVRSEYGGAEQAAVLPCKTSARVFVICRTPGIGLLSSIFDIYRT